MTMELADTLLLERWQKRRDADAFSELIARHAHMVYGTCLRVAKNPSLAEEVAQECFVELMRGPRDVRSPGGWLHTVATRRSLDRLKSEGRRVEREADYAAQQPSATEPTWDDTREHVDEAIAALPEELRAAVVLRFLEGRSHTDMADELRVSRKTVRLRIERGIDQIRETLGKKGVAVTTAALGTMLEEASAETAPAALVSELGKRVLATPVSAAGISAQGVVGYFVAAAIPVGMVVGGFVVWSGSDAVAPVVSAHESPSPDLATEQMSEPENRPTAGAEVLATAAPDEIVAAGAIPPEPAEATPVVEESVERVVPAAEKEPVTETGWVLDLSPSEEVLATLQNPVNIEFETIHVKEAIEFIQDSFELNIVLDSRVVAPPEEQDANQPARRYVTDGYIKRIEQRAQPLEKALTALLTPLNLTYKVRGHHIWVSSSRQITEDLTLSPPSAIFREGAILGKLEAPVNIEFEDIHLGDIIGFIGPSFDVDIRLDALVIAPESGGDGGGYVTNGMIEYINLKDVPMGESLYVMTRLLDLTYRVGEKEVFVSTKDRIYTDFPVMSEEPRPEGK